MMSQREGGFLITQIHHLGRRVFSELMKKHDIGGIPVVDNGKYAAIPIVGNDKKLMVIYNDCKSMKVCRNKQSAINFIEKERKRKNKS